MSSIKSLVLAASFLIVPHTFADQLIYIEEDGGGGNPRGLYNFDTITGDSTFRAPLAESARFYGLAVRPSDGTVFSVSPDASRSAPFANKLWTIDINTGAATFVGDLSTGDAICNIGFDPTTNVLYGLERNNGVLFTINQTTAARTTIGTTDTWTGHGFDFSPNGTLFATTYQGELYTINKSNAHTTLVGGTSSADVLFEDAAFGPAASMYVSDFYGKLWRFDATTGAKTTIGTTNMGLGLVGVIYLVPEPSAVLIGAVAVVLMSGIRSRRSSSRN